jgi:hypothetical protein
LGGTITEQLKFFTPFVNAYTFPSNRLPERCKAKEKGLAVDRSLCRACQLPTDADIVLHRGIREGDGEHFLESKRTRYVFLIYLEEVHQDEPDVE